MMTHPDEIVAAILAMQPRYQEFLGNLVSLYSPYGAEGKAQLFVKTYMETLGLPVEAFLSRDDSDSLNLVSVVRGTDSDYRSLILNAHCDVAPVDAPETWHESLYGEIRERSLYGRGALDDKAGIALILLVVNVLRNLGTPIKGDIIVQFVVDDESSGMGSKVLVENGFVADGVIICDGTWPERIIYAHLGQVWIDVKILGEPVAACVASRGVNPVYLGIQYVEKLKSLIEIFNRGESPFEGIERPFFMNVGAFHSGSWHGSVPANADIAIQIGFSDKFEPHDIVEMARELARNLSDRITVDDFRLKTEAYRGNKRSRLVSMLKNIVEMNTGKEVRLVAGTGHCDMRFFPTDNICLYGPGGGKNPHGRDEHYFLDHMPIVARNLIDFILEWCNEPKGRTGALQNRAE